MTNARKRREAIIPRLRMFKKTPNARAELKALIRAALFDIAPILIYTNSLYFVSPDGGMVDAQVSGTCGSNTVEVQVLFWAPPFGATDNFI